MIKNRKFKKECKSCNKLFKPNSYKNKLCEPCKKKKKIAQNKINSNSLRLFYKDKKKKQQEEIKIKLKMLKKKLR